MEQKNNLGMKVGIAAGVTAAAAAAVGAYWLYGAKHSAKHRKMAKSWMLKARAEVMEAVEKMAAIDRAVYLKIVDEVMKRYASMKDSTADEVSKVARELKSSWSHIQKAHKATKKSAPKKAGSAKKSVKAKKASK
ncbi:MAG: hypothetical protein Greene07147_730 [Parcubacteria group bacterium Greene0714_7]|nr:MAG: hypothetical protein Greene07147_730 [Parcubacteria group bacterium Greene0714_7]